MSSVWLVYFYTMGKKRPSLLGVYSSRDLALKRVERLSPAYNVDIRRLWLDEELGGSVG